MSSSGKEHGISEFFDMMICEDCGGDTTVYHSQGRLNELEPGTNIDVVKRRRRCLRCDSRFITYERRERDPQELWPAVESAQSEKEGAEQKLRKVLAFVEDIVREPAAQDAVDTER